MSQRKPQGWKNPTIIHIEGIKEEDLDKRPQDSYAEVIQDAMQQAGITKVLAMGFHGEGIALLADLEIGMEKIDHLIKIISAYLDGDIEFLQPPEGK